MTVGLDRVEVEGSSEVQLIGSALVPVSSDKSQFGASDSYPPDDPSSPLTPAIWSRRLTAGRSATVAPNEELMVVLGLRLAPHAETGTLEHTLIRYHVQGKSFTVETRLTVYVVRTSSDCAKY